MHSTDNLLKFAFLTLTLATGYVLGECTSNDYVPGIGCDPSPNICEVICHADGDCTLSETCADALVTDTITHSEMTEAKCQELCQLSDAVEEEAKRCRFWRYVSFSFTLKKSMTSKQQELISNDEEVCSLMNLNQCTVPKVCTETSCYTGDVGCANGETPDPGFGLGCAAAMTFNTDAGFIHCTMR